jgi:hypothetical protein
LHLIMIFEPVILAAIIAKIFAWNEIIVSFLPKLKKIILTKHDIII